jgi:hypothetical protein
VETTDATKLDPRPLATLRPMSSLSYTSGLVILAAEGSHGGVKMDPFSFRRLMAWVDANCPHLGEEALRRLPDAGFRENYLATQRTRTVADITYVTLQLFVFQSGDVDGPIGWKLQFARFAAPLTEEAGLAALLGSDDGGGGLIEGVHAVGLLDVACSLDLVLGKAS